MNSQENLGLQNELHGVPEMKMVGEHHVDVLRILPAKHRIEPLDLTGEERHAFILDSRAVQSDELETNEIGRLKQLRQDQLSVVRRVSRVVSGRTVVVMKEDKAGVLDPVCSVKG